jgi:two-component system, LytTR family, response regulator
MRIRVWLVDDEAPARLSLRHLIELEQEVEVIGESPSGKEAVAAILEHHPDLVFLDIQMPEMSGIDVIRALPPDQRPATIFVSAGGQHALEAFEVHALDYLLKPCQASRLQEALRRAREHFRTRRSENTNAAPDRPGAALDSSQRPSHITVKTGGRTVFIPVAELDYIESAANYAILHVGAENHVLRETLMKLEAKLPPQQFLRVSRCAIVNLDFINEVDRAPRRERVLVLKNGKEIAVTCGVREIRRRRERLRSECSAVQAVRSPKPLRNGIGPEIESPAM